MLIMVMITAEQQPCGSFHPILMVFCFVLSPLQAPPGKQDPHDPPQVTLREAVYLTQAHTAGIQAPGLFLLSHPHPELPLDHAWME